MQSVLAKLSLCRTPALGSNTYQCDSCSDVSEVYHSCGDRHCPQCSGRKRYDFAQRASKLILPAVTYYQVVFTLPSDLSQMALANRMSMAELLFQGAWKSLRKSIRNEQGYSPAAMMVLHTWNQQLRPHWHVHALVPGAGPSHAAERWKLATAPQGAANSDGFYLVDAINLRETFRRHAIAHLKRLRKQGKLKLGGKFADLQDDAAWESYCDRLSKVQWVSYIQPPPTETSTADQVVRYLTRYLTGGPISDHRIVAADTRALTFMAREGKQVGGEARQVPVTLSTSEFIGRWCDHIQPNQLTKTRYFGGWCNLKRDAYLRQCQRLLDTEAPPAVPPEPRAPMCCSKCEQPTLRLLNQTPKPSWSEVLSHRDHRCPKWYVELSKVSLSHCLAETYGIGYEDWDLGRCLESAIGPPSPPSPRASLQLYLPSMHPDPTNALESG